MLGTKRKPTNKIEPNAVIVVERTKKRIFRRVNPKYIPVSSFEKRFNGSRLHILGLDLKGELWPIEPPLPKDGRFPVDLFMAVHCADEVNEVYGLSMPMSEKIKLGILAGLCFGILIVIFLIAASSGG